ncbi:MAG: flavodoxin [Ponticaulis sp.]|nr:flavodoxin [Ponticaulis sp.]|tara:strand:+ start:4753 stop:5364 length:612 start_codon:yes stop_codon:yes gene_type:complete
MNVLIINGHYPFPSSKGGLNAAFAKRAADLVSAAGYELRCVSVTDDWNLEAEIENHLWADFAIYQFPLNSMSVPWRLKQYLDEVFTAGMDGRLAKGDGRSRRDPTLQYGSGGKLGHLRYMLSVTANAPSAAFNDPSQHLFSGKSIDDLLAPVHINFAFFGMCPRPTFAAYDVSKNPQIDTDFSRFDAHLKAELMKLDQETSEK